jgi:hypothetical protein
VALASSPSRAPDIDVHLAGLGDLLRLLAAQQMDRLLADHAFDGTVARIDHDALADEHLRVPAADLPEPQKAVVVDVRDDQADLVDVTHHEQAPCRAACAFSPRDERQRRTDRIDVDLREAGGRRAPHADGRGLVARRAPRLQQLAQDRRDGARAFGWFRARCCAFGGSAFWLRAHASSSPRSTNCRMPPWRK